MHTCFGRIVIAWALVLLTVWLGERLYRNHVPPALRVVHDFLLRCWQRQ